MTKDDAVTYATEAHRGQMYGDKPYVYHLEQVAKEYLSFFRGSAVEDGVVVAYLHDVLEDTDKTEENLLQAGFSQGVVSCVSKLTFWNKLSREQYIEDIRVLRHSPTILRVAWEVKVADTMSNLRHSVKEGNVRRISKYMEQVRRLYA